MNNAIEALRESVDKLPAQDREFAQSLLDQAARRGLSSKQYAWVDRLVQRATTPPATIGDVTGVIAFMEDAMGRGLMRPKIRLRTPEGVDLVLSIAGPSSREPGSVLVLGTGSFENRSFYGRISTNGTFTPGRDLTPEIQPGIIDLLSKLAADPEETTAAYGLLTKMCCFCNIPLSDPTSLVVGYGRICARKFGLPWGVRS